MLIFGCSAGDTVMRSCKGAFKGVKCFASVAPPAIEVSGTPALRGGGSGNSDEGWYAVAVCICRFADCRYGNEEAKVREHCGHLRGANDGAANRGKFDAERASAPVVRGSDIVVGPDIQQYCDGRK